LDALEDGEVASDDDPTFDEEVVEVVEEGDVGLVKAFKDFLAVEAAVEEMMESRAMEERFGGEAEGGDKDEEEGVDDFLRMLKGILGSFFVMVAGSISDDETATLEVTVTFVASSLSVVPKFTFLT
jgi:hypothetical protein